MSAMQQFNDSITQTLRKFTGDGEQDPRHLRNVLDSMLNVIDVAPELLEGIGAPDVVVKKYQSASMQLRDETVDLKKRARAAERTLRELVTSAEWYWKATRAEFLDFKKEAMAPCLVARDILDKRVRR